jgi:Cytochrome P450
MPTVYANDPKTAREVLFRQEFDGRPDVLLARLREPNFTLKGIFFIEGDYWLHQRRFTLRNLRDFGFGRRCLEYENEVLDEMKDLVNLIKEGPKFEHEKKYFGPGGNVFLPQALIGAMGNCFLQVLANERLPRSEQHKIFK